VGEIRTIDYPERVWNCGNQEKGKALMHKFLKPKVLK
jgi:hypothetical protein